MKPIAQRLESLRAQMAARGYDALVVPRADEYLGEYIPAHNERLRWVSGFTGSAGTVVVMRDRAAIFVDGRYTVQVRNEVSRIFSSITTWWKYPTLTGWPNSLMPVVR